MQKQIKGLVSRRPPEPTQDHSVIETWCGQLVPGLQPIVRQLDEWIRETVPDAHYAVKWKRAFYGLEEPGWIIELAAYDVSVNVLFFGGADFESPPPLGTTDRTRYVKVTNLEHVAADLQRWISCARHTPGWK